MITIYWILIQNQFLFSTSDLTDVLLVSPLVWIKASVNSNNFIRGVGLGLCLCIIPYICLIVIDYFQIFPQYATAINPLLGVPASIEKDVLLGPRAFSLYFHGFIFGGELCIFIGFTLGHMICDRVYRNALKAHDISVK